MTDNKKYVLGILAFGSLIDNPGKEISELETNRIKCETPFNVEFARISSTRGNAPTLIPVEDGGKKVKADIIVLKSDTNIESAKSILWRRESHKINSTEIYTHTDNPGENKVVIRILPDFSNVQTVLYTSIGKNIEQPITAELLASYAINSILSKAGQMEKDGLRYLLMAKRNGIITGLSVDYEKHILLKTNTTTLEQAIEKLDRQRLMYPNN